MGITVTFEAHTSKDLYKAIADFLETSATTGGATVKPSVARAAAAEAKMAAGAEVADPPVYRDAAGAEVSPLAEVAAVQPGPPAPTPAVLKVLKAGAVTPEEYVRIERTGANGRMTQGDVKKYITMRVVPAPTPPDAGPVAAALEGVVETPVDLGAVATTLDEMKAGLQSVYDYYVTKADAGAARAAAFAVLSRFGVSRMAEVHEDRRGEFVAYCAEVAAGKADPEAAA